MLAPDPSMLASDHVALTAVATLVAADSENSRLVATAAPSPAGAVADEKENAPNRSQAAAKEEDQCHSLKTACLPPADQESVKLCDASQQTRVNGRHLVKKGLTERAANRKTSVPFARHASRGKSADLNSRNAAVLSPTEAKKMVIYTTAPDTEVQQKISTLSEKIRHRLAESSL